jgi:hypothetical protein
LKKFLFLVTAAILNGTKPARFGLIWYSGFRGEDFLEINHQKQEWPVVAMFANGSELNEFSL